MSTTVGRSHRTPAKHAVMKRFFGTQVGVMRHHKGIRTAEWADLTAGDGVVADDAPGGWESNCSPGIMAYYARASDKPICVTLYERQAATFDRLQGSLSDNLPRLGYRHVADWWLSGNARIHAVFGSGADASLEGIRRTTAVVASNDPNAITEWAMRPTFAAEMHEQTPWFTSISTMGCNPAGLKRLKLEERRPWFDHIERQIETLQNWHDLLLVEIEKDDAQWGYLLSEPVKWRANAERDVCRSFGANGLSINFAWLGLDPDRFAEIEQRLFLTKKERGE